MLQDFLVAGGFAGTAELIFESRSAMRRHAKVIRPEALTRKDVSTTARAVSAVPLPT